MRKKYDYSGRINDKYEPLFKVLSPRPKELDEYDWYLELWIKKGT